MGLALRVDEAFEKLVWDGWMPGGVMTHICLW
jgi:hypothetical protein